MPNITIFTYGKHFLRGPTALDGTLQTTTNPSEQSSGVWLNNMYVKLQAYVCICVTFLFSFSTLTLTHWYCLISAHAH